jgi:hypothetical protein
MTMEEVVERHSMLFLIIGLAICISTIATHLILSRLCRDRPEVLRAVGISRVDWWFACWRGIVLLAFSGRGGDLSGGQRLALRVCIISSASLVLAGLITTAIS